MIHKTIIAFSFITLIFSCNKDSEITPPEPEVILTENVTVYVPEKIHDNLSLLVKGGSLTSFLIDKKGNTVHEWNFETKLGNDFELLPNGKALVCSKKRKSFLVLEAMVE